MSARATSSVLGVVLLTGVAVLAAAAVGVTVFGATSTTPPRAAMDLRVDAATDRLVISHRGGDALHVDRLRVRVWIDDRALHHQPPVPFFAAEGFESGPTGPFNSAADDTWTAGERASVTIASTNEPSLHASASVRVAVYHGSHRIAVLRATA